MRVIPETKIGSPFSESNGRYARFECFPGEMDGRSDGESSRRLPLENFRSSQNGSFDPLKLDLECSRSKCHLSTSWNACSAELCRTEV